MGNYQLPFTNRAGIQKGKYFHDRKFYFLLLI